LNGIEKQKKRRNKIEEEEIEWDYIYKIEMWLKNKFNFGDYCYTWAVFDCCRSIAK